MTVVSVRTKSIFLIAALILIANSGSAQLTGTHLMRNIQYTPAPGKVTIIQNQDIVTLIDKHLHEEGKQKGITGYRIRIFSNSGAEARKQGEKIKAGFISRFEDIKTYYIFDSPFYLLYVGDFRTHSEAMHFLKEIEGIYPDAFIVRSRINYPLLK